MLDSKTREELNEQLVAARQLLTGPEWAMWLNFLKKDRRKFLQKKVNAAVEQGDIVQAQIAKAMMDDCVRQIELFGSFVRNMESEFKKEDE